MNGYFKQISIWIILLIIVLFLLSTFSRKSEPKEELWSKHFEEQLFGENIKSVDILKLPEEQYKFKATFKLPHLGQNQMEFETDRYPAEWVTELNRQGIASDARTESTVWTMLLLNILPIILIIGVFWFFMFRHMQGGSNKAMSFGKSRAKLQGEDEVKVTFADVAGIEEAKQEVGEDFDVEAHGDDIGAHEGDVGATLEECGDM